MLLPLFGMSVGSLQTSQELCFVRWADNFIPVLKPINEVAAEPSHQASRAESKSKYSWVPLGEALLAMTNGDALAVYIPAPPDENGQERVWAWSTSGNLDKEEGESVWYCAGPYTSKEAQDLAASWSRQKDHLSLRVELKGVEDTSLAGLLGNAFEVSGKDAERYMQPFLEGLLEYFTQIEEEKGHALRRRYHRYPFILPRSFLYVGKREKEGKTT